MITEQTTNELIEALAAIQTHFADLVECSNQLEIQMQDLLTQGIERGYIYMRKNGYMYLIYPMSDGKRLRKYIGPDPENQKAVRDSISRTVTFDKIANDYHLANCSLSSSLLILNDCNTKVINHKSHD
jgi:hypothetical protein